MQEKIAPFSIYAESTPNPATMKFVANRYLVPNENVYEYQLESNTEKAPLAANLLQFPFIKRVFIAKNFVSLTKIDAVEWEDVIQELRMFIGSYMNDGGVVVKDMEPAMEENSDNEPEQPVQSNHNEPKNELEKKIIDILDEYIKPAVEGDGGAIAFESFNEGTVNVILKGACSGCPSSTMTLKAGIEGLMRQMLPDEVKYVEAINE